jgi:uncharacterized membrane protein
MKLMSVVFQQFAQYRHRLSAIGILVLSTLVSLGLLIIRWIAVGYPMYRFLVWDLFLAWMPFWISVGIYVLHLRGKRNRPLMLSLGFAWLLFFPNAPYMLTEFVHLSRRHDGLWWFDLVTVIGFAWNGLMLGLLSLYTVQQVVSARLGMRQGWWMALAVLILGSLGIALGRFQRFNSWDVIRHPLSLVVGMANDVLHPEAARTGYVTAFLLCGFLLLAYLSLWAIVTLNDDEFKTASNTAIPTVRRSDICRSHARRSGLR